MPRLKPSRGFCCLSSPFPEFPAWIRSELNNLRDWNPHNVDLVGSTYRYHTLGKPLWTITVNKNHIVVRSQEPVVYLRQNLAIRMGDGRLILDAMPALVPSFLDSLR